MIENPRVKFAFNLNPPNSASTSPISSLACDQECRLFAVGGRDILKLVEINFKDEKFVLKRNLRQTRVDIPRQNTVYLEWNPTNNNLLAAAALGGSISIWDVNQGVSTKLNKALVSHNQAINKLNWHPTDPKYLISASHDCTVKLWDLDDSAEPQATIKLNSSVRDVKFVPSSPHQIVAALESGGIEVFDTRKDSQSLFSNPNAHRLAILAMDFNPFNSKLFATGSIDKLIKIWDIDNIENELYKIKYLSGVGFVKWKPDDATKMCVSSYSGDNSLSLWNTEQINYPMGILKGHKDVVTACVYETQLNYLITGSKDGYLICHPAEGAYKPMDYCNKYGLALDSDSTFAFTNNNKKLKTQSKSYRNISLVSRLNRFFGSKFTTLKDEIKYYSETYKKGGEDVQEICEYNSKVAFDKKFVSKIWKDIPTALKEMTAERDTTSLNFGQFLKVNSALYDQDVTPLLSSDKTPKAYLNNNDVGVLVSYYEKHPDQFKSDYNDKLIAFKDGKIYIKPQYMKEVLRMIEETSRNLSRHESRQQDLKKIEKLTYESIIKTVQELANVGELQSAYHLYFALYERISFPESSVRLWAQAYIELLRTYQFYQDSNEIIRSCPLQIISDGNKKSTTFYSRCGKCKKTSEFDDQYICSNCKNFISMCAICKLPVKGLMLWCQVCGHGGHYREVYSWFQNHSECPSGCGHKCFFIKSKSSNIK